MTKSEAVADFMENVLPCVKREYEKDGRRDLPARCEAWNDYTDALCKDGKITMKQYETWTHPACNE